MTYKEIKISKTQFSCSDKEADKIYLKSPDGAFLLDNPDIVDSLTSMKLSVFMPHIVNHLYIKKDDEQSGLVRSDFTKLSLGVQMKLLTEFAGFFMDGVEID